MRILITGSRNWDDETRIEIALTYQWLAHDKEPATLVTGECPTGADRIAEVWASKWCWAIEPHPADWKRLGKKAGFVRNQEMVDLGADACLAFIRDESKGATHTASAAEKAGIPTTRYIY